MMRQEALCVLAALCLVACPNADPNPSGPGDADVTDVSPGFDVSADRADVPVDRADVLADRPAAPDVVCASGRADCDREASNGCETSIEDNVNHCGACGSACESRPRTTTTCAERTCRYACESGFGDCTSAAGCETDLRNTSAHCGMCGSACAGSGVCVNGVCLQTCSARCCDGVVVDAGYAATQGDCWARANTACASRRNLFSATFSGTQIPDQCGGQYRWDFCVRGEACATCERTNCCPEGTACGGNPACVQLLGCILGCTGTPNPGACVSTCRTTHAAGAGDYDRVTSCHQTRCRPPC
jgi:hypothetical protein